MVRIKRGSIAKTRRKTILKFAKGFQGSHSNLFKTANGQVMKAWAYKYVGRKERKKNFKLLWICRVNAISRINTFTYNRLRTSLKKLSIDLNVKILSQLSILDKKTFEYLIYSTFYK